MAETPDLILTRGDTARAITATLTIPGLSSLAGWDAYFVWRPKYNEDDEYVCSATVTSEVNKTVSYTPTTADFTALSNDNYSCNWRVTHSTNGQQSVPSNERYWVKLID